MTAPDSALAKSYSQQRIVGSTWARIENGAQHIVTVTRWLGHRRRSGGIHVLVVAVSCHLCGSAWEQRIQGLVHWTFKCKACSEHATNPNNSEEAVTA